MTRLFLTFSTFRSVLEERRGWKGQNLAESHVKASLTWLGRKRLSRVRRSLLRGFAHVSDYSSVETSSEL
jgi:hypothetical protein